MTYAELPHHPISIILLRFGLLGANLWNAQIKKASAVYAYLKTSDIEPHYTPQARGCKA